jgi:hypothetical protein
MKTLQECKDEVAQQNEWADWHQIENCDYEKWEKAEIRDSMYDQVAELYAQQFKEENTWLLEELTVQKNVRISFENAHKKLLEEKAKLIEALKMVLEADLKQSGSEHSIFTFDQQLQIQKVIL